MAPDGIPRNTDVWADDPDVVDRKVPAAVVGDSKGETRVQAGEHGPIWDMEEMVDEEGRGNGMALQELWHSVARDGSLGKNPVIGHQEGDIVEKRSNWGHVDQHYKSEVVGLLHFRNGHNKALVA